MGMYSYACSRCGSKSQFDWMSNVVVKVEGTNKNEDLYVRGTYDGYGRVQLRVANKGDGAATTTVNAHPWQFRHFFGDIPDNDLLCSKIYCDGNGGSSDVDMNDPSEADLGKLAQMQMKAMERAFGGGGGGNFSDEEEEPRHCVPQGIQVLDELPESVYTNLRKLNAIMRARAAKEKKRKQKESKATKEEDCKPSAKDSAKRKKEGEKAAVNNSTSD